MTKRRIGSTDSSTRTKLMDAVEDLMRERGYAALSARNVAKQAGLKYQIVFYYFPTMDELLLAAYQRRTNLLSHRVESAVRSERPLHELWHSLFGDDDGALSLEYMAMSNHNAAIRAETVKLGERMRRLVAATLPSKATVSTPDADQLPPLGVTWILNAIICLLSFESALGLSGGHREVIALVEEFLDKIEPKSVPRRAGGKADAAIAVGARGALAAKRGRPAVRR